MWGSQEPSRLRRIRMCLGPLRQTTMYLSPSIVIRRGSACIFLRQYRARAKRMQFERTSVLGQGVVAALAELPGDPGVVGDLSIASSLCCSFDEQVGKQAGGVAGCRP